jgi:hypothetical protein
MKLMMMQAKKGVMNEICKSLIREMENVTGGRMKDVAKKTRLDDSDSYKKTALLEAHDHEI